MFRFLVLSSVLLVLLCGRSFSQASFTAPDTVCVNTPVNIQNTSIGAATYFWNFCSGSVYGTPQITNLGNTGGVLNMPSFLATAKEGNNYYAFVVNFAGGSIVKLDFGTSMLNTPIATNLGTFGGGIPLFTEGVQVVQDATGWHVIVVGGPTSTDSKIIKLDFGASLANPTPVFTDWGNLGSLAYPQDLYIVKEGLNWFGLTVNKVNHTVTRFAFGTDFTNPPIADNLGSLGNLSDPTGIFATQENGNWHVFITNESSNELVRYDFGSSLANMPTSTSLGNPGNVLNGPRDLCIIRDCGGIFALGINNFSDDLVRLDFNGDITSTSLTGVSLGNGGNLSFPVSISTLFREGNSLYAFITNVDNNTISRLEFNSCNNSSIASSTLATVPAISYNTPGTYTVHLLTNESLPTQSTFCKEIVVMPTLAPKLGNDTVICSGSSLQLDAGAGGTHYLWNTGATTQQITVATSGIYSVTVDNGGCTAKDTIQVRVPDAMTLNTPVLTNLDCITGVGRIDVHPTGGVRPFHYYLNGVDRTTDSIYNIFTAGSFTVQVVDSIGCTVSGTYAITGNTIIPVKLGNDTVLCGGSTLVLNGGAGYTSYLWNTGATSQTIIAATTGTYFVEVSQGSCITRDTINVRMEAPMSLNTPVVSNIDCGIPSGQIEVHPTGGIRPYTYYVNGTLRNRDSVYNNLVVGNYFVRVVDAMNCEVSMMLAITENTAGIIRATGQGIAPTCNGRTDGSINIQVQTGTAPFEYAIRGQAYQTGSSFTDLGQGTYRIYIRNAVCIDSVDVELIAPAAFRIGVNTVNEVCERSNGSVGITAAGGVTPYSFYWDNVLLDSLGVSRLSAGTYALRIVDANGCGVDTSININNVIIPPVQIMNRDTVVNIGDVFQLHAVNATDYQWTPVDGLSCTDCPSPFAKPLRPTTYIVRTVTGLNCVPADTINITLTYNRFLYAPSAFSPNKDGQNDVFRVKGKGVAIYHLFIYNRWGLQIYRSDDMNMGWNGFYKDELQPVGAYVYMVQYAFYGEETKLLMQRGAFTLIK